MASIDTRTDLQILIDEFFRIVSFQPGYTSAYGEIHELFIEDGKLIKNNSDAPEISTIDQFIAPRQQMVHGGGLTSFQEIETAEITEVVGNIAHRFSTYVKRSTVTGHEQRQGVISRQFIRTTNDGG